MNIGNEVKGEFEIKTGDSEFQNTSLNEKVNQNNIRDNLNISDDDEMESVFLHNQIEDRTVNH